MTSKELVLASIERKKVERIPWVPFCGVHTGSLIGVDATEYLQSADNMVAGLEKAIVAYRPDGLPIAFDLQIEAEILGCDLNWSKDNPPAVISHPLTTGDKKLEDLHVIKEDEGRIPLVLEVTERIREDHPDLALYGLITGPFTLALHLLGADIFMQMFDNPEYVNEVMDFCVENAKEMSRFYIEKGCDIIAIVDPMTSQIGPDQFKEFCSKPCQDIFDYIRSIDAKSSFFVCGHAQNNISVMCDCHCDNISIDENIPLDYVKEICNEKGVSFGGNLQLTATLLFGTEDECRVDAIECMQIGGDVGFLLAPGCDIAYATPEKNLKAVADLVHDIDQQEIAKELSKIKVLDDTPVEKLNYKEFDAVRIELVTLDSEGCAPCQYMVAAVKEAAEQFGNKVICEEYKIKTKDGIQKMKSLGVSNIPTTCIDGDVVFISLIPTKDILVAKIQEYIDAK